MTKMSFDRLATLVCNEIVARGWKSKKRRGRFVLMRGADSKKDRESW